MALFYEPKLETLIKLQQPWCCSYSGGKDSTSLVTWIEYLRRTERIKRIKPQLVQADTLVEYPILGGISNDLKTILERCGWECALVIPAVNQRLYNRILGIGNMPIHPGIRRMRWCTRSTKIDPMEKWRKVNSSGLCLTGLRLGESKMRDGKIKRAGCSAGGECGIPEASERTFSPILHWGTCHVIDWLNGHVGKEICKVMSDIFAVTKRLVEIYDVKVDRDVFEFSEPTVTAARFGCIGCPAIQADSHAPKSSVKRHGADSPLNEIYDVWFEARRRQNRCWRYRDTNSNTRTYGYGPIKMEVRKKLFDRIIDIQTRAGITLVSAEDEAFIRQCWKDDVYPRGWSAKDESNVPPKESTIFELNVLN